jgi:hypothetical protein
MEDSQIEEPDYLDGRYIYDPDFDDSQVGTGPGLAEGVGYSLEVSPICVPPAEADPSAA